VKNDTPLEDEECYVFADWCRAKNLLFTHLAQETFTRYWSVKMKNKNMGVNSGIPDYILVLPQGLVFIEMKRQRGGVVSEAQKQWIEALEKIPNVTAKVCKGANEAIEYVEEILTHDPI